VAYLLRTPVAVAIALISAFAAAIEILAIKDLFTPALVLWALCVVLLIRSALRRRRGPAIAYALGALPATVALAALLWVTA
jgi:beta-lactamase regulating signal transducer with metallopeptidase domain